MYRCFLKRLFDIMGSFTGLIILSPLFIIITLLLYIFNERKPFFLQKRPGKNARIFTLFKFKTMNENLDSEGNLLPDHERITRFGDIIRKASIDEIPQLINVLKGDMSLVGPRPLLVRYIPRYNNHQSRRHEVRPGLTGWAQVNGRNSLSWEKRLELDVWYVDNYSLYLDFKIVILTIKKVLAREGINQNEMTTASEFMGN
jgi:undecaprenyl phosphate N,N'-diacetylbacillosamine 1-phosphate transferase